MIEKQHLKYTNIYDYVKLEQIALFRSNIYSIKEFAHLFYMVMFELFDQKNVKLHWNIILMAVNYSAQLPHVFEDNNNYGTAIFIRTKHSIDSQPKIGIKITHQSKKMLIKDYQDLVKKNNIILHNDTNILELTTFTKKETASGDITFNSETGNDDTVMSSINVSTLYNNVFFKDMVDQFVSKTISEEDRNLINTYLSMKDNGESIDYNSFMTSHKRIYGNKDASKGWNPYQGKKFTSPFSNPFDYGR